MRQIAERGMKIVDVDKLRRGGPDDSRRNQQTRQHRHKQTAGVKYDVIRSGRVRNTEGNGLMASDGIQVDGHRH